MIKHQAAADFMIMKLFSSHSHQGETRPHETVEFQKMQQSSKLDAFPMAKTAQIFFIVMGGIAFAYVAQAVVLPLLLAWLVAMTLKPAVGWLRACHFPAFLAAAVVLGIFLSVLGFGGIWLGRPAVQWTKSAPEKIPQLREKIKNVLQPVLRFSEAASSVGNLDVTQNSTNVAPSVAVKDNHTVVTMITWTRSLLAGIGETIVLTFLLLLSGDTFMQKLAEALPNRQHKKRAVEISRELQSSISNYLFTVSLVNIGLGCVVGIVLWLLGLPNAAMWGGVTAILNFLPFFGPIVGIGVVGLAGLLAFDTFGEALLPVAAYLGLHLVESYLVTPFALGQRFRLNRVVIFVAFIFFAWLWGVIGALLAVPLLVSLKVICEHVPVLLPAAKFLSP
jgi:predicted PurR-regulated permease PerM